MKKQKVDGDGIVFLRGKKTVLRPLLESDIPLLQKWINDPDVRQFLTCIFPAMEAGERDWLEHIHKNPDKNVVLMIVVNGQPIGTMGLHGINWKDRVATTGAMIGEKSYWGKGYGTDAKMTLLDYAFNTLGLRKIVSRVFAFNGRSLAYSLHCGYEIEGRLKRQRFVHGRYWDEIILGLFKSQWLPYWEKYNKE
jgi:RimJ/RimL family protein N-acetyltransferase